jgi:hypothetical protein
MRRLVPFLFVLPALLVVSEIRLSRGEPNRSEPEPPALWAEVNPPGAWAPPPIVERTVRGLTVTYPGPSFNCAMLLSTDLNSRYVLTSVDSGVDFDIDADGDIDRVAWTDAGTDVAFLAIDSDGDGRITNGRELIGDSTLPGKANAPNVLMALAREAIGGKFALVDAESPLYSQLWLWRDTNHDGISDRDEIRQVSVEFAAIALGFQAHRRTDGHGNRSRYRGFAYVGPAGSSNYEVLEDRTRRRFMYEVCLATG